MNILTLGSVSFGPDEVRAIAAGKSGTMPRCVLYSVLTSQTCGEPCWHAVEDVCRCSCGGKNHGCLKSADGVRPVRMSKIDGERYKLAGVGLRSDLIESAQNINGRQWKALDEPETVIGSEGRNYADGSRRWTEAEADAARAAGKTVYFSQYYYAWSETDSGAPARMKYATREQVEKWPELAGWKERAREGVCLLWEIEVMPKPPRELRINRETGKPLANQSPNGAQI